MIETDGMMIRAVAGQPIGISMQIVDETGENIKDRVSLMLHDKDGKGIYRAIGLYLEEFELWQFEIPADVTKGLDGKHWYCIQYDGNNLCFKHPIYLKG